MKFSARLNPNITRMLSTNTVKEFDHRVRDRASILELSHDWYDIGRVTKRR